MLPYKPAGGKTVKELIEYLDTIDSRLDGGRGAGSGQMYKFGHAFEGVAPAGVSQLITLIMEPDISVAEGACVDITFSGGTVRRYILAGVTARYARHQEIALELREEHP